jgi:hypothetical protein
MGTTPLMNAENMETHQETSVKDLAPAIEQYKADGVGEQSAIRDLLTDIRHYCDAKRLDFHTALDGSYDVYCDERYDDDFPTAT